MTFFEYVEYVWDRQPTDKELKPIINIVTWNIWQMDGLTGTIPFKKAQEQHQQLDMFSMMGFDDESKAEEEPQPLCRIFDWRSNKSITYMSMKENNR